MADINWFQAVSSFCAFGGFGLGIFNVWKNNRTAPPVFEKQIIPKDGYWIVEWNIRNPADVTLHVTGIADRGIAFSTRSELPDRPDTRGIRQIPRAKDPKAAEVRSGRRDLNISIKPRDSLKNPIPIYFKEDPSQQRMAFHWRWSHRTKSKESVVRMKITT